MLVFPGDQLVGAASEQGIGQQGGAHGRSWAGHGAVQGQRGAVPYVHNSIVDHAAGMTVNAFVTQSIVGIARKFTSLEFECPVGVPQKACIIQVLYSKRLSMAE